MADFSAFARRPDSTPDKQQRDTAGRFVAGRSSVDGSTAEAFLNCFGKQGTHVKPAEEAIPLDPKTQWDLAQRGSLSQSFQAAFAPESVSTNRVRFEQQQPAAAEQPEAEASAPANDFEAERARLHKEIEDLREMLGATVDNSAAIVAEAKQGEKAAAAIAALRAEKALIDEAGKASTDTKTEGL
ncbi:MULTISPECIES: hypothetical protein [unclassified Synechococcus]|uniref:hypothetical protein n=1 Tax=unclassified Synechococcus TaxID=2626047 RepID=UPI0039AFACCA